ncbi:MAG TPA: ATP-binding protein [Tepidisphaeraceae bacterium]|nr:ATP-binding protein [Tepidisphaeraceae bacterium]
MSRGVVPIRDERVLVLAPTGRDALLTCSLLEERAQVRCEQVDDLAQLSQKIIEGAGTAVIAEEAMDHWALRGFAEVVKNQPTWSDFPLLILSSESSSVQLSTPLSKIRDFANITVLDRPLRIVTLVSSVHAALRARRRQYEVRDLLAETRNAVKQRDQFLAMLGHELRNPLATVSNALNIIDASCPSSDNVELEHREIIRRQLEHLSRLVDDLLDVSRITSGKVVLQRKPVNVCELVHRAVTSIRSLVSAQGHELSVYCPENQRIVVEADTVRLEQVFNNLLTNAVKYTPSGGKIWVTVEAPNGEVSLRFKDNGIGMTPELLPRVFELFTQADRSLDRAQGGMGIGLTLVRSLVEMHGGRVHAHSEGPGRGSEFTITLPRSAASAEAPRIEHPPVTRAESDRNRRILVVEDNPDARRVLKRLLEIWGHKVSEAEDGAHGLQRALTDQPEVALIDVGLPGMDGYSLAQTIRQHLGGSIRLVALTGYGQPEDRERAHAAGFDLHLVKPVNRDELARAIASTARSEQISS